MVQKKKENNPESVMKLGVDVLQSAGAFIGAPVRKTITWEQDGAQLSAVTCVRKLSYRSAVADVRAFGDSGNMVAGRIAACICDEEGKPIFTVGDINGDSDPKRGPLNHNLTVALLNIVAEVNSSGKTKA